VVLILIETIEMSLANMIGIKVAKTRDDMKPIDPIMMYIDKSRMKLWDTEEDIANAAESDEKTTRALESMKKKKKLRVKKSKNNDEDNDAQQREVV
jgi:hypothetical protein